MLSVRTFNALTPSANSLKSNTHAANTSGQTTKTLEAFLAALLFCLASLIPGLPSLFCRPKPQGALLKVFNLPQTDGDSVVLIALPYSVLTGAVSKRGQKKETRRNRSNECEEGQRWANIGSVLKIIYYHICCIYLGSNIYCGK